MAAAMATTSATALVASRRAATDASALSSRDALRAAPLAPSRRRPGGAAAIFLRSVGRASSSNASSATTASASNAAGGDPWWKPPATPRAAGATEPRAGAGGLSRSAPRATGGGVVSGASERSRSDAAERRRAPPLAAPGAPSRVADYTRSGGSLQITRELLQRARRARADRSRRTRQEESVFSRSGGFVYARDFFSPDDFRVVREACETLRASLATERRACAKQRLGVMIPREHVVHRAFMNQTVADRISRLVGKDLQPADVPVEFRVYPPGSAMDWHQDVALYTEPQYELVFTLDNTSDSQTQWQDGEGARRGGWTEPNSVIVVRAESVIHRVTPITKGERSIVKFAFTSTLEKTREYYENLQTYD